MKTIEFGMNLGILTPEERDRIPEALEALGYEYVEAYAEVEADLVDFQSKATYSKEPVDLGGSDCCGNIAVAYILRARLRDEGQWYVRLYSYGH